jgi:Flp pilus assembly protein CpaB
MFNRRRLPFASKVLAGLSLTCGVIAFLSVRVMEARLVTLHPSVGPPVSVVVAAIDARRGSVIDTAMIKVEPVPSTFAPPGALQGIQDAVGRVLLSDVATGEILTQTRLASRSGGPIAALVPSGLRAVVVIVGGSAQDLRPGDRVDVLAAFGGDSPHTEIAGHDLELLRAANAGEGAGAGSGSQTGVFGGSSGSQVQASLLLLVDPTEAERLAYAQAFASLSIAVEPALGSR